jgi:hypothetical protein
MQGDLLTKSLFEPYITKYCDRILKTYDHIKPFLGAFAKLLQTVIKLFIYVCLSVRPSIWMEQLGSYWTNFYEIWYSSILKNL